MRAGRLEAVELEAPRDGGLAGQAVGGGQAHLQGEAPHHLNMIQVIEIE